MSLMLLATGGKGFSMNDIRKQYNDKGEPEYVIGEDMYPGILLYDTENDCIFFARHGETHVGLVAYYEDESGESLNIQNIQRLVHETYWEEKKDD